MKKIIHKTNKICAMCRYWNNGRGCDSLVVKSGGFFEIDNMERKQCYKTSFSQTPFHKCNYFEKNY